MSDMVSRLCKTYDLLKVPYQRVEDAVVVMTTDGVNIAFPDMKGTVTMVAVTVDPDAITDITVETMSAPMESDHE